MLTKSMLIALQDLKRKHLFMVYPGKQSCALDRQVDVISIQQLPERLAAPGTVSGGCQRKWLGTLPYRS